MIGFLRRKLYKWHYERNEPPAGERIPPSPAMMEVATEVKEKWKYEHPWFVWHYVNEYVKIEIHYRDNRKDRRQLKTNYNKGGHYNYYIIVPSREKGWIIRNEWFARDITYREEGKMHYHDGMWQIRRAAENSYLKLGTDYNYVMEVGDKLRFHDVRVQAHKTAEAFIKANKRRFNSDQKHK